MVFEATGEERFVSYGDWFKNEDDHLEMWKEMRYTSSRPYKIWRVVKENEVPLTKDDFNLKIGDIFYVLPKTKDKSWRGVDFKRLEIREDCIKALTINWRGMEPTEVVLHNNIWEFKKK